MRDEELPRENELFEEMPEEDKERLAHLWAANSGSKKMTAFVYKYQ